MKTFLATFAAIVCAAAVIFGVYSHNQKKERERLTWYAVGQKAIEVAEHRVENLTVGKATAEEVEHFRDFINTTRETLRRADFPKDLAPRVSTHLDDSLKEFRRKLGVHRDTTEMQSILAGL